PQAIVDSVIELPEANNAGELDDLWRREMLFQLIENLIWHSSRIGRRGPYIIETDSFEFIFRLISPSNDCLKLRFLHAPAFEIVAARLFQHRATVRSAIGAAIDGATDHRKLALEELVKF